MSERMTNYSQELSATGVGTMVGLIAHWLAVTTPAWVGQAAVTLTVSMMVLILSHFVKRELNRRWPDRYRRKGDTGD